MALVLQAVRHEIHRHPQLPDGHVLPGVVAHHQALLRPQPVAPQELPEVARAGLAEGAVLIAADVPEGAGAHPCPADAHLRPRPGEDGVRGKVHVPAMPSGGSHRAPCEGGGGGEPFGLLKRPGVVVQHPAGDGLRLLGIGVPQAAEENGFIGGTAVVSHHGGPALVDEPQDVLRRDALRRGVPGHAGQVPLAESVLVHGQQGPVQVKEDVSDHRVSFPEEGWMSMTVRVSPSTRKRSS